MMDILEGIFSNHLRSMATSLYHLLPQCKVTYTPKYPALYSDYPSPMPHSDHELYSYIANCHAF